MRTALPLLVLTMSLVPLTGLRAEDARAGMRAGEKFFQEADYEEAANAFGIAVEAAKGTKLDVAAAYYNQGNAVMMLGDAQRAASIYADALKSTDLDLQSRAYFNRGNALYSMAQGEGQGEGQLDTAVQAVEQAVTMYENAIALTPHDLDSKINYELALKKLQELKQQQREQQQQEQQEKDQQKEDQEQEEKDQSKPEQNEDQQEQGDEEQKDQQQQDQQQQDQQQQDQQQQDSQQGQQQQPTQPMRSEEMTPQEAKLLLDSMKQEEQARRDQMRLIMGQPVPVDRDW